MEAPTLNFDEFETKPDTEDPLSRPLLSDLPPPPPLDFNCSPSTLTELQKYTQLMNEKCSPVAIAPQLYTCDDLKTDKELYKNSCHKVTVNFDGIDDLTYSIHEYVRLYHLVHLDGTVYYNIFGKRFEAHDVKDRDNNVKEPFTAVEKDKQVFVECYDPYVKSIYYIDEVMKSHVDTTTVLERPKLKRMNALRFGEMEEIMTRISAMPMELGNVIIKLKRGNENFKIKKHLRAFVNKQNALYYLMDDALEIIEKCKSLTPTPISTEGYAGHERYLAIKESMPWSSIKVELDDINNQYKYDIAVETATRTIRLYIECDAVVTSEYVVDNVPLFFLDSDCSFYNSIHTNVSYEVNKHFLYHYLYIQSAFKSKILKELETIIINSSERDLKKPIVLELCGVNLGGAMVNLLAFELQEIIKTRLNNKLVEIALEVYIITMNCPKMFRNNDAGMSTVSAFNQANPNNICLYTSANYATTQHWYNEHLVAGCYATFEYPTPLSTIAEYSTVLSSKKQDIRLCITSIKTIETTQPYPHVVHYKNEQQGDRQVSTYKRIGKITQDLTNYLDDKWYYGILALAYRRCRNNFYKFLIDGILADDIWHYVQVTNPTGKPVGKYLDMCHIEYHATDSFPSEDTVRMSQVSMEPPTDYNGTGGNYLTRVPEEDQKIKIYNEAQQNIIAFHRFDTKTKKDTMYICVGDIDSTNADISPLLIKLSVFLTKLGSGTYERFFDEVIFIGLLRGGLIVNSSLFQRNLETMVENDPQKVRYYTFNTNDAFEYGPANALHFRMKGADFKGWIFENKLLSGYHVIVDVNEQMDDIAETTALFENSKDMFNNLIKDASSTTDIGAMFKTTTVKTQINQNIIQAEQLAENLGEVMQTTTLEAIKTLTESSDNQTLQNVAMVATNIDYYGIIHGFGGDKLLVEALSNVAGSVTNSIASALPFIGIAYSLLNTIFVLQQYFVNRYRMLKERSSIDFLTGNLKITMIENKNPGAQRRGGRRTQINKQTKKHQKQQQRASIHRNKQTKQTKQQRAKVRKVKYSKRY